MKNAMATRATTTDSAKPFATRQRDVSRLAAARSRSHRTVKHLLAMAILFAMVSTAASALHAAAHIADGKPPAGEWGSLSGEFVFEGTLPEPKAIEINKDAEFCGREPLFIERLVVNESNRGIANVVIWLDELESRKTPDIHPGYSQYAEATVSVNNKKCRFEPRVVLMRTTQSLTIGNLDDVDHNAFVGLMRNGPSNLNIPPGKSATRKATRPERVPGDITCSSHAWMKAFLLVKEHPYMAVTDRDGRFVIKSIPTGEWKFRVWHEQLGLINGDVTRDGKPETWSKGLVPVTLTADAEPAIIEPHDAGVRKPAANDPNGSTSSPATDTSSGNPPAATKPKSAATRGQSFGNVVLRAELFEKPVRK